MGFSEDEFIKTMKELENPELSDYEFFVESHGVKVYRKYSEESGLYQYKVIGEINVDPQICADVYMDLKYRKVWDSYAADLRYMCEEEPQIVYWQVAYPWPMSHRDYLYVRQKKVLTNAKGNTVYVVLGQSAKKEDLTDSSNVKEKSGVIRVDDFVQGIAITNSDNGGTRAFMHYYDNPKGSIPTWLINWAAKSGVPDFLSTMETACNGYKTYLNGL
ncbi:phosphatidylcholine transfer protein-like [Styela clava]